MSLQRQDIYCMLITGLTFTNLIFLPPAYFPTLIYFGRERDWWVTFNYTTVLKELKS
jgi:hypothetical protein